MERNGKMSEMSKLDSLEMRTKMVSEDKLVPLISLPLRLSFLFLYAKFRL